MGTMKLIAPNCIEEEIPCDRFPTVQKIKYCTISPEAFEEMKRQVEEHWNDPQPKILDYMGCIGQIKPIHKSAVEQYEKIASEYSKEIEGINYDDSRKAKVDD